ncbi:sigma-70 family RNA polymerase sigma factor [Streptomyces sp. NPDC058855]|uniref:sigma-70 family RNA polymerase sigma factor n=1 Tax=Streptomyces sp. NPDC058855 TaxID=3346651 RepID=UPI00367F00D9
MHTDEHRTTALVEAARAGDPYAREELVRAYLPLVHNIVGRALDGHADTDDIVQETMVSALDGLPGLRDPARFRSWLVAIAMNGVRRRWRERQRAPLTGLDRAAELADPAGDFTALTILRLGLSGQRRDVARATRWLDGDDRELLSLWWLEAAGELTRAEVAEGLGGISPQHAAVRIQRMKERLETGRAVVRALDATPPCPGLGDTLATWDGRPSPLWRKRVARHLRDCAACTRAVTGRGALAPVEGLLVGLGLVPPLAAALAGPGSDGTLTAETVAHPTPAGEATPRPGGAEPGVPAGTGLPGEAGSGPHAPGAGHRATGGSAREHGGGAHAAPTRWTPRRRAGLAGAAVLAAVLGALAPQLLPEQPQARPVPTRPTAAPPPPATPLRTPVITPAPAPTTTTPPPPDVRPSPRPTTASPAPAPPAGERVTALVNRLRAEAGCAPLRTDPRLVRAARAYARDMAARGYYGHSSPEGAFADSRITAEGYAWSAWAENLARGTDDPAGVVEGWTDGAAHEENMLDCRYRDTGVASAPGPGGTIWVQKLAAP